jgi:hypothetical protein
MAGLWYDTQHVEARPLPVDIPEQTYETQKGSMRLS